MVNLKANPFYLDDEQIAWVENTIAALSTEEKIGQLFVNLTLDRSPENIEKLCRTYHIGGVRWTGGSLEEVYEQNRRFQEFSSIPVLIAANCEAGGNGAVKEGTLVATHAACGASGTPQTAYEMAQVAASEATAIGCNWSFSPITDLYMNWRNTIVNMRSFGSDPDRVIEMSKAYMKGMKENKVACCVKHFPGDGVEERDQHLVVGYNELSCEEWDATFGKVYKELFQTGAESVMIGHIALPNYSRRLRPGIKEEEILPATLSPELLQDLLREQLGFNGLIVTDASHMAGLTSSVSRKEQVVGSIAAGCDMFLFFNDIEEDFNYMKQGYEEGVITQERLSDALHRILGIKAKVGLHRMKASGRMNFPDKSELARVGCREHHEIAKAAADRAITLVKDTQGILPVNPDIKKRVALFFIESAPISYLDGTDKAKSIFIEELERAGFEVTAQPSYYELEAAAPNVFNRWKLTHSGPIEKFKSSYDLVLLVTNMKGYAQTNNVRLTWSVSHSNELPWYVHEVPAIGISLSYTNHLFDMPMLKTFIHAYSDTQEYIRAVVEKITGKSKFCGTYDETVWCGRWETKL